MKKFLLQIFTWWHGQTVGTRFYTWRRGKRVGEDEFGNVYYRDPRTDRRWVIYNGLADPSAIPASWHGWMHHTVDEPPTEDEYEKRDWEVPHQANMTGTWAAYRPDGSILTPQSRPKATGDYDAWSPE